MEPSGLAFGKPKGELRGMRGQPFPGLRRYAPPSGLRRNGAFTPGDLVHRLREFHVELGHAAGVMGRERHFDGLVDVEPFGVMIEFLGDQRGASHKAERGVEIREHEFPGDRVASLSVAPVVELRKCRLARIGAELVGHLVTSRSRPAAYCATITSRSLTSGKPKGPRIGSPEPAAAR